MKERNRLKNYTMNEKLAIMSLIPTQSFEKKNRKKLKLYLKDIFIQCSVKQYVSFLQQFKTTHGCIDCGFNFHPAALDFDHIERKLFNLATPPLYSKDLALTEISKCEIRCANCHRIITVQRREKK